MPKTASFEQHAQPYSYQQQNFATQSSYAIPQQPSFAAYPQPVNYPSAGDMPQFQFYPSAAAGADGPSKTTGPMNHAPAERGWAKPAGPMNHAPSESGWAKPAGPMNHAPAGPVQEKPTGP